MVEPRERWEACVAEAGAATLEALAGLEAAARRLHLPTLPSLREGLRAPAERLSAAEAALREVSPPAGLEGFHGRLLEGVQHASVAASIFVEEPPPSEVVPRLLASMRRVARAQAAFYPLRRVLPSLGRFFAEAPLWHGLDSLDPEPAPGASVGMHRAPGSRDDRGGFALYVPERYTPERRWPLVVALHGGWGHGDDFLWTWLREARSRGCLVLAPTSRGSTWSLHPPDVDAPALASMLAFVHERWSIDPERMLLTGLSDGATYTLLWGLAEGSPFSHLAPLCGVLHPDNVGRGNLERARGRRIWLGHGAHDWLFPVELARLARDTLLEAGAELVYREIADLAHAYPREENARILEWMDPGLALPAECD